MIIIIITNKESCALGRASDKIFWSVKLVAIIRYFSACIVARFGRNGFIDLFCLHSSISR